MRSLYFFVFFIFVFCECASWPSHRDNHEKMHSLKSSSNATTSTTSTTTPCTSYFQCDVGLICANGFCSYCSTDSQCEKINSKDMCMVSPDPTNNFCQHKGLLKGFDVTDLADGIIALIAIMLSAPAGIGGGGILVPMFILVGRFSPHGAIPISKAAIFGGSISNNIFSFRRRHPIADRPMIDFDAVVVFEPPLLLGTVAGVFFNAVAPGWLLTSLLVITLIFTTWRAAKKAWKTYKEETYVVESTTLRNYRVGQNYNSIPESPKRTSHKEEDDTVSVQSNAVTKKKEL